MIPAEKWTPHKPKPLPISIRTVMWFAGNGYAILAFWLFGIWLMARGLGPLLNSADDFLVLTGVFIFALTTGALVLSTCVWLHRLLDNFFNGPPTAFS